MFLYAGHGKQACGLCIIALSLLMQAAAAASFDHDDDVAAAAAGTDCFDRSELQHNRYRSVHRNPLLLAMMLVVLRIAASSNPSSPFTVGSSPYPGITAICNSCFPFTFRRHRHRYR